MRRLSSRFAVLQFFAIAIAAASAFGQDLIPPADSTKVSRERDLRQCVFYARGAGRGYSSPAFWDEDLRKRILDKHDTGGFIVNRSLSEDRATPVTDEQGYPVRAAGLFQSSSAFSDRYVVCLLGLGYRWQDVTKSYFESVRELANAGMVSAQAEVALLLASTKNPDRRADYNAFAEQTRKAAEQGYAIAQFNMGMAYSNGDGVERNDEETLLWWRKAAAGGYERARLMMKQASRVEASLRDIRQDTRGLDQDKSDAEAGDAGAQFRMAARYEDGRGVERDMKQALAWYLKAAEKGSAAAQGYLGVIYDKGRGVKQDEKLAASWLRKAADGGDAQSQYNLGIFYFYGRGVEKNPDEARKWIERARDSGYPAAAATLKEYF